MTNADQIITLLSKTATPNDSECLKAIRMANRILLDSKRSWESVFAVNQSASSEHSIREMLDMLLEERTGMKPKIAAFITSLSEYFEEHGYLSDRQEASLHRTFKISQRKGPGGGAQ